MSKETEALVKQESEAVGVAVSPSKAIVLEAPIADPTNDFRVKAPPACEGCGGPAHGSINRAFACLTLHMQTARSAAGHTPPRQCKGCGQAHRSVDQLTTCLEDHLTAARAREGVGVSVEEFHANQAQSRVFEQTRGKNKKGGGG